MSIKPSYFLLLPAAFVATALLAAGCTSQDTKGPDQSTPTAAAAPAGPFVPLAKYDPARDPAVDLQSAVAEASKSGKRVLLEVGGEWCVWCHIMDDYFEAHPDLRTLRDDKFVTLKVNYSDDNQNKPFLSGYPKIPGYPHLFVLESNGTFLHSQNTAELESGRSYDLDKFTTFLKQWAPVS
ncbi:MAG TPA: thioredoxin family protein [Vicinamibacterales bacterium]|nr:thioredoxin family protein [Vicinamibacterales bacterium]